MNAAIGFTEGPAANPPDPTQTMAIFAVVSGQAPSADPTKPNIIVLDSPPPPSFVCPNGDTLGYGPGPEVCHYISRRGKRRVLLVPCTASTAATCSAVTQTGSGPLVTVTATSSSTSPSGATLPAGPYDDAKVLARIVGAGVPGVASVQFSWTYVLVNGLAAPLWQGAMTVPARAPAQVLGTVDLTTIVYATPAIVTGTVDLTTKTYGPGGTYDTLTLILTLEGTGPTTVTLAAPASPLALAGQINTATTSSMASINQQNQLVLTGTVPGASGAIINGAGTANTLLGLTPTHTTNGIAGTLDGLTLLFSDDQGASQTVTFSAPDPTGPAAVIAKINAATGITAAVYTAKSLLQLVSKTLGGASTLTITGGTGRVALGLPLVAAAGAESTYTIPHLGLTVGFTPNVQGSFVVGTQYAWTTRAAKPSDADIILRIADLDKSGYPYGAIYIASETDVVSSLARETMLDAQMTAEHAKDNMVRSAFGFDVAESATNIRTTFLGTTTAWVDRFADAAYIAVGNIPGGGWTLRSTSWSGAMADTFIAMQKDRGDHMVSYGDGIVGLPDVGGITRDESIDGTKLVDVVQGSGTSCNVLTKDTDGGYYFEGGYSSAVSSSAYTDSSVRNVMLRSGTIVAAILSKFQGNTDMDTNSDGTLSPESAEMVQSAIETALAPLVPVALQGDVAVVDTTTNFYQLKSLRAATTGYNRVPVRSVGGTVGPGLSTGQ